jgi:mono/diheme cytochrome c family protein
VRELANNGLAIFGAFLALEAAAFAGDEFFETRVRPLLVERCFECHGPKRQKSGLRLDSRAALLAGGERGPAAVAGDVEKSLLVQAVRRGGELEMPPKRALTPEEVATLVEWVERDLPWAEDPPRADSSKPVPASEEDIATARTSHWAYQPIQDPPVPEVRDAAWVRSPIDRFVLAELEARGLRPAPPADRRALLRRVSFDLTGLPPTPEETEAFVADASDGAFERVVDRLLASPRYGERQARTWLDLVRYCDSFDARLASGDAQQMDVTEAWRYRDWVVDAFQRDLPYDQFVLQQLAGDILCEKDGVYDPAKVIATGVLALGNWGGGDADKEKLLTDIADDQVDLVGRAFLGLTVACARCHDHKFDPIPTADYYGLAGIFFSSHILADVGPKTNGPPMLRIPLCSSAELSARAERARAREERVRVAGELARDRLEGRPLAEHVVEPFGQAGLHAWKNEEDTPSLVVNTRDEALSFLTVSLPPQSAAIHPSPGGGVAVAWSSSIEGEIRLEGRVADADPNCGDGVEWSLVHVHGGTGVVLANGALENGAAAELAAAGDGASRELHCSVAIGDKIGLLILPRAEYTCDTTVVDLAIVSASDPMQRWDLAREQVSVALASSGALGGATPASAWSFQDLRVAELAEPAEPPPAFTNGVQEGGVPETAHAGVHDVRVHQRGRYDRLGDLVARHFPRVIAGDSLPDIPSGSSGRLELARWLVDPANPLPARVIVNRVWQQHFGRGLVATPSNFGRLGVAPTHPELLDWLATRFVEDGWSIQRLHRLLLLTSVYQQSSVPEPATRDADPEDRLLGWMRRRRLEAEELRDGMLAVSGEIDLTMGGPAVRDAAISRRTLYVATIRSDRSGFRELFDAADPTAIVDQRTSSTIAPQALWILNAPFALDRAAALARRIAALPGGPPETSTDDRIERGYELLFARRPSEAELALGRAALETREEPDLARYCHALFCTNEWMFVD